MPGLKMSRYNFYSLKSWFVIVFLSFFAALGNGQAFAANISVSDTYTGTETNAQRTIAVWLSSPNDGTVVNFTIADGSATLADEDYRVSNGGVACGATSCTGSITFNGGSTIEIIEIEVLDDNIDEDMESVTVTLTSTTGGSAPNNILDGSGTLYISDDDLPPSVNIADNSTSEPVGPGNTTFYLYPYLSNPSSKDITFDYNMFPGSATSGADYISGSGRITIAAGSTQPATDADAIPIIIAHDTSSEDNETIIVTLMNPVNASLDNSTATIIIEDNDPVPNISILDTVANEDVANVTLNLNSPAGRTITVQATSNAITATEGIDYPAVSQQITFNAGETSKIVAFTIHNDEIYELDETFEILLSNPSYGVLADNSSLITIQSDDPMPTLSIGGTQVAEGNPGDNATVSALVTIDQISAYDITFNYSTADGTAVSTGPNADFTAVTNAGPVTILAGNDNATISINLTPDTTDESDTETFQISLVNSDNNSQISALNGSASVGILDDDDPPTIDIAGTTNVSEDNGTASVTVSLSAPSGKSVTGDWAITNIGTDLNGLTAGDFTGPTSGQFTINPYDNSTTISIGIDSDGISEITEQAIVEISNIQLGTATLGDHDGDLFISDSAASVAPVVSIAQAQQVNEGGNVDIAVTLDRISGQDVVIGFSPSDGTADSGADGYDPITATGTLIIAAGETSGSIIGVHSHDDDIYEGNQTFDINLSVVSGGATLSPTDNSTTVTIIENEAMPTLSIAGTPSNSFNENDNATVTFTLSGRTASAVTFDVSTINGSAVRDADFTAFDNTTLTIEAAETSYILAIPLIDNTIPEYEENFSVQVSNLQQATLSGSDRAVITINDNDPDPEVTIRSDLTIHENDTGIASGMIELQLSGVTDKTVSVDYTLTPQTASESDIATALTDTITFSSGTLETLQIEINGDIIDEDNETIQITLSEAPGGALNLGTPSTGIITIVDNDFPPVISFGTIPNGVENHTDVRIPVNLSSASERVVRVDYIARTNGSASSSEFEDPENGDGFLEFQPGETIKYITINLAVGDDLIAEADETFEVVLQNPINGTISAGTDVGEVTIQDNEDRPQISIADIQVNEDIGNAEVTVSLNYISAVDVTVDYVTLAGSADNGSDYVTTAGTLTIDNSTMDGTILVPIIPDGIDEESQQFDVVLSNPQNATLAAKDVGTITIFDLDPKPTISISDNITLESTGQATLTLTLSSASEKSITVNTSTHRNGTTAEEVDFTQLLTTPVTFAPGDPLTKQIQININNDNIYEIDETFIVLMSDFVNVDPGKFEGLVTIQNDDPLPEFSIQNVILAEQGNPHQVSISLEPASEVEARINYKTQDGSATFGSDYNAVNSTQVTFAPGSTSETVPIVVLDDGRDEPLETFEIVLENPVEATLSLTDDASQVTITDINDPPTVSIANNSALENATSISATVSLNTRSDQDVVIYYTTQDDTAVAGEDYVSDNGSVTIPANHLTREITINLIDGPIIEDIETFNINLTSADNATIADASAIMTINDDEAPPVISIVDNSSLESDQNAFFTINLSNASEKTITVDYTVSDDTAERGSDYSGSTGIQTVTFTPNQTSKTLPITLLTDGKDEDNETIRIDITSAINATTAGGRPTGQVTIIDADNEPTILIDQAFVQTEGSTTFDVPVTLSAESGLSVTAKYRTIETGSAKDGEDFNSISGNLTFNPGSTQDNIQITLLPDSIVEGSETFEIELYDFQNASGPASNSVVTINESSALTVTVDDNVTITEGLASNITFNLSNISVSDVTVNYSVNSLTATAVDDYNLNGGTITISAGDLSKTVLVTAVDDSLNEGPETFSITIDNASAGVGIPVPTQTFTIADNDGDPELSIADVTVSEAAGEANLTVRLNYASSRDVLFTYTTNDSSAINGQDYNMVSDNATIPAGETTFNITVPIVSDETLEADEIFTVSLSNPLFATTSDAVATVTITEAGQAITDEEFNDLKNNLLFGKNSIAKADTQFYNRLFTRNRNLLMSGNNRGTDPQISFNRVSADWNDKSGNFEGGFTIDDLSDDRQKSISLETSISYSRNSEGVKNTSITGALNFGYKLSDKATLGYLFGFGYSDTTMSGSLKGENLARSGSIGVYTSYEITDGLIFDIMASKTHEENDLNTAMNGKTITGKYNRDSSAYSTSLQGVYKFPNSEIRPTFSYTKGKSVFENAYFTIKQGSYSSTQQLDFGTDEYYSLSFSPEYHTVLGDEKQLIRPYGFNLMQLKPKLFCEKYSSEASTSCGQGIGLVLSNKHPSYSYNQSLTMDYEKISDTKTYSLSYKRVY